MGIADTILEQLGGRRFRAMTGARDFMSGDRSLYFTIPTAKSKITKVKIALDANDTYTVEFGKVLKLKYKIVQRAEGIVVENLREVFTCVTGLYCTL